MIDLSFVRKEFTRIAQLSVPSVNVYGYPEPQPEYPCARLGNIDTLLLHQAHCRDGSAVLFGCELMVANADSEAATENLEALLSGTLIELLEDQATDAWSNLVVSDARNVRRLEDVDGLACDITLTVYS